MTMICFERRDRARFRDACAVDGIRDACAVDRIRDACAVDRMDEV